MRFLIYGLIIALIIYAFSPLIPGIVLSLGIFGLIILINVIPIALGLLLINGFNRTKGR